MNLSFSLPWEIPFVWDGKNLSRILFDSQDPEHMDLWNLLWEYARVDFQQGIPFLCVAVQHGDAHIARQALLYLLYCAHEIDEMLYSSDPFRKKQLANEYPDPEAFKAMMSAHFEALEPHITAELRGIYELLGVLVGAFEVNDLRRLQQHPHVDREFFAANMLLRAPQIEEIPEMLTWIRDPDERHLLEFAYLYPYQQKTMSIHDFACLWSKGWKVADLTETDDEMQVLKRWQSDVMELIFHNLTVHFTLEERVLEKWFLEDGSHELGTGFESHMDEAIEMLVIKCLSSVSPHGKQVCFNDTGKAIDVLVDLANRSGIAEWVPDLIEWQPEPEAHRILLDLYKWGNVPPLLLQLGLFHTEEEIWSRLRVGFDQG